MAELTIKNLSVEIEGNEILKDFNLALRTGEIHAIMGPNGTGKSTLAYTLMGHPGYEITGGEIAIDGQDITEMEPDERAHLGLFLAFQYPYAVPGVSIANFLRTALNSQRRYVNPDDKGIALVEFRKLLKSNMELLKVGNEFAGRYLNDGFSGGEKKRVEILQMLTLKPTFAILDEPDS
ncbi:MAG: Fe-S cluster assembly ATPase SufC, partial [Anaerolineaceae bacterium]|nr:Fe-S cluster assembly ATPase SufC [Anaerolineaceae bacterium]